MKLAISNHMKFINFGGADFPECACKVGYSKQIWDLAVFRKIQNGRESVRAVDLESDGCCASPSSGRPEHVNKHGSDEEEQVLTVGAAGGDAEGA